MRNVLSAKMPSILVLSSAQIEAFDCVNRSRQSRRMLAAAVFLLILGTGSPASAQDLPDAAQRYVEQDQPVSSTQSLGQSRRDQDVNASAPRPVDGSRSASAPIPQSIGLSGYRYVRAPRAFPNPLKPYSSTQIPLFDASNSLRVEQLIHDGRLEITLHDAIELVLENSIDIAVARYNPWIVDSDILAAESGALPRGVSGEEVPHSIANIPGLMLDPTVTTLLGFSDASSPVNNPFTSGTGTTKVASLVTHTAEYNTQYSQGFTTGTTVTASWDNTRSSSSSSENFLNPSVQSSLNVTLQQQLMNGFGRFQNRRNIIIAKNNRTLEDYAFEQQVITTITNTIVAYWELVYAREIVKIAEQAVSTSNKFYDDNRKELKIGAIGALEVTRAESELAADRDRLVAAKTTELQNEQVLKNAILKDPFLPAVRRVEIVPTDPVSSAASVELTSIKDAVQEAFAKRPDLLQQSVNVENAAINARATRYALLPTATLTAQYQGAGLAGNSPIIAGTTTAAGSALVGAGGQPLSLLGTNGVPVQVFEPNAVEMQTGTSHQGFGATQSQIFHNQFPNYLVSVDLQAPLRNRAAQATDQRSVLGQREIEVQLQQMRNAAILDVSDAYILLTLSRSQVESAHNARELRQKTFNAEQRKHQLGRSLTYDVILTQRDLINSEGAELRALADLAEAKANYERAVGRTLEVNLISIAGTNRRKVAQPH